MVPRPTRGAPRPTRPSCGSERRDPCRWSDAEGKTFDERSDFENHSTHMLLIGEGRPMPTLQLIHATHGRGPHLPTFAVSVRQRRGRSHLSGRAATILPMSVSITPKAAPRDCIFCAIVDGKAEASVVYQDEVVVVFMDLTPVTPGHLLVVPRVHATGLEDLEEETGSYAWTIGHRMAKALRRSGLRCEGINVLLADGHAAFQEVFHFHLHVFPRYSGDGYTIGATWEERSRDRLDAEAEAVKAALATGPTID